MNTLSISFPPDVYTIPVKLSVFEIKEMLGHDDIEATRKYLHIHIKLMRGGLMMVAIVEKRLVAICLSNSKKNVNLFGTDRQYAQGWSDGFRQCETEQEAMQRQIRMGMVQQQFMELKKHNDWEEQRHLESELLRGIDTSGLKNLK